MFATKQVLLAAAAVFALSGAALANEGADEPFAVSGRAQVFGLSAPRLDLGAEAYPSTIGGGADWAGRGVNNVTRDRVPAYQHGFDTGSEAYPAPR